MILHEICAMKCWDFGRVLGENHDNLIQRYLKDILKEGAWCGSEIIAAVTRIYQVSIVIYTEDSDPWCFTVPNAKKKVDLFFSGQHEKNHYDVVVKVELLTTQIKQAAMEKYTVNNHQTQEVAGNEINMSLAEGDSLIEATVKAWLGLNLNAWELKINALNLRRASINELSLNSDHYMTNFPSWPARENFDDILTHWYEEDHCVDIEVGAAIAEVLQANYVIHTMNKENIKFTPRASPVLRTVEIRETRMKTFVPIISSSSNKVVQQKVKQVDNSQKCR